MPEIPQKAVEAAQRGIGAAGYPVGDATVRLALEAAYPFLVAQERAESEGLGAIGEVERVAEAFYEALPGKGWTNGRTGAHVVWANLRDEHKVEWLQAAGTALAALRPDREQGSSGEGQLTAVVCEKCDQRIHWDQDVMRWERSDGGHCDPACLPRALTAEELTLAPEQAKALDEGIGEWFGMGPWPQGDKRYQALNSGRAVLRRLAAGVEAER